MPKPYSADLRERVLLADAAGLSPAVIAVRFGVGLSTVYLWRQQARAEGRRCAKPHAGGRALGIDAVGEAILRALVSDCLGCQAEDGNWARTSRALALRRTRSLWARAIRITFFGL